MLLHFLLLLVCGTSMFNDNGPLMLLMSCIYLSYNCALICDLAQTHKKIAQNSDRGTRKQDYIARVLAAYQGGLW